MDELLLGIDFGTTGVKAALFLPDGRLEAVTAVEYATHHLRPGWVEQQPEDWWNCLCAALYQILDAVPQARERILGLAVSSQAPTLIALDESGLPLRPAMIWMDRRAEAEVNEMSVLIGADEIFRISGNRPDPFYVAGKLRWLKKHEPETLRRTKWFVQIPGFINYRLTGVFSLDSAHTALIQLRDHARDEWSAALCDACGVDPSKLPPILPGPAQLGEVSHAAAKATGLRPGTPVMAGTVDGAAAAIEAGVAAPGIAAEMTGTSTVLIVPNAGTTTERAFISLPHALPGLQLFLGAMVSSGASINWFRDQFGQLEQQRSQQSGEDVFDLLIHEARKAPVGSENVIFLPYMMGERSPLWHTNARGVFFGLSLSTSRGAVIRAILEGTAYALRHNVEVAQAAGIPVHEMHSVGGGTRSALWNQIKADVLGIPVCLPETSVGAPFGDAFLVGLGMGLYPDPLAALNSMIRIKSRYQPKSEHKARYDQLYRIFRDLYHHVRDDFDRLAAVR